MERSGPGTRVPQEDLEPVPAPQKPRAQGVQLFVQLTRLDSVHSTKGTGGKWPLGAPVGVDTDMVSQDYESLLHEGALGPRVHEPGWRGQDGGVTPAPAVQASRAEFSKGLEKRAA